jgi:alginate O-acetyltransferase complex protein AlgI
MDNLPRLLIGAFKSFVIAGLLQQHALPFLDYRHVIGAATIYLGFVTYYWFEYMNFAGYTDMAIATSRMAGISLPENFNHPYLATSLTDLWRRWHMTLAAWLRDYVYYPVLFTLMSWLAPATKEGKTGLSALSIFITFAICGLWHGQTYGMLFFGLSSGVVLAAEAIISAYLKRPAEAAVRAHAGLRVMYPWALRVVTFHIAIITFGPVLLTNEQLHRLIDMLVQKL